MNRYQACIAVSLLLLSACGKSTPKAAAAKDSAQTRPVVASATGLCGIGLDIDPTSAVATLNGVAIPCSELFEHTGTAALTAEAEFREELRAIHQQGLSELVDERLLQAAADEKKLPLKDFVATTLIIEPTGDDETRAFYDQAVAQGEKLPAYEEIAGEITAFLNERKQKTVLAEFRATLRSKAKVDLTLPLVLPPKFDVVAEGPSQGPDTAAVTIVEFSDYQCHFCGKVEPTVHRLISEYGDKVRFVYRDYPLPNHPDAPKAAEATHCAGKQGKYWELHDLLFANQTALGLAEVKGYAASIGLNSEEFLTCLDSGEMKPVVVASLQEGEKVGVNGTPAFFVNGRMLSGAQPYERFKEIIDHELQSTGTH